MNDDKVQQGRVWVCKKTGVSVIATKQPIGSSHHHRQDENLAERAVEE